VRVGLGSALLGAVLLFLGGAYASEPDPNERGELLFHIGGCTNCHTAKNGPPLAGGDPLPTPFGTFHPPNITPDPETGIGGWTDEDFIRAMREGRAPDGTPYYPAFPYTSYRNMLEDDLRALKAYLDTLPAVRQETAPQELGFPYDQRWGLHLWQWLFLDREDAFEADPSQSEAWNRGAYLVLGPGHCAECHTPRSWYGALDRGHLFAGAGAGKERVPNITSSSDGIGDWSTSDITTFLKLGIKPDGDFVGGEMARIVSNATSKLPQEDIDAIAAYLQSLPPS
jgi:mono/diheme cytochrome c family protein